ncbi:Pol polyprotein [Elysia marginata]|uniref:Pol polyprotein n=1 Tax=Elysia marginata TaxID=1093978 RepID=A0AAV4G7D5_9GAST|nr:Pol polyprotein [Elysia marginata]
MVVAVARIGHVRSKCPSQKRDRKKSRRLEVLSWACESPLSGHTGFRKKTLALVRNQFSWPGLTSDVHQFLRSCHTCQIKSNVCRDRPAPSRRRDPYMERRVADETDAYISYPTSSRDPIRRTRPGDGYGSGSSHHGYKELQRSCCLQKGRSG